MFIISIALFSAWELGWTMFTRFQGFSIKGTILLRADWISRLYILRQFSLGGAFTEYIVFIFACTNLFLILHLLYKIFVI